jgi:AGZA family xanthine/uracil permease-like MFS transporter
MIAVMEAQVGIKAGGRTGLTAVFTGVLFALGTAFAPVLTAFPPEATACPLVLVGMFLFAQIKHVDWDNPIKSLPCFVTIAVIPATTNIAYGVFAGLGLSLTIWLANQCMLVCIRWCRCCGGCGAAAMVQGGVVQREGGAEEDEKGDEEGGEGEGDGEGAARNHTAARNGNNSASTVARFYTSVCCFLMALDPTPAATGLK